MSTAKRPSRTVIAPGQPAALDLPAAVPAAENSIVSKSLLDSGTTRVVLFGFDTGQELTEHATPCRALIQVLAGRGEFIVAGERFELGAGGFLHMPPSAPHAVRALAPMSFLLTMIREPAPAGAQP